MEKFYLWLQHAVFLLRSSFSGNKTTNIKNAKEQGFQNNIYIDMLQATHNSPDNDKGGPISVKLKGGWENLRFSKISSSVLDPK